jgi:hypothetical protein
MGSSSNINMSEEAVGIIPRVIHTLFETARLKEKNDPSSTYKIAVQFLEIYGEDIRDLLDQTRTSKVSIRETVEGEVFVSGAREELVSSAEQMMKALEDGTKHRTTAATKMNQSSSRSHGNFIIIIIIIIIDIVLIIFIIIITIVVIIIIILCILAIFTVILEHTIYTGALVVDQGNENSSPVAKIMSDEFDENIENISSTIKLKQHSPQEVRKCKFHFVDLAGSERAKRTGAQGLQLKEGIDINKGLLS